MTPTFRQRAASYARTGTSVAASVAKAQRRRGTSLAGKVVVAVLRGIARLSKRGSI